MNAVTTTPLSVPQRAVLRDTAALSTDCVARYLRFEGEVREEALRRALRSALSERADLHVTFPRDGAGPGQRASAPQAAAVGTTAVETVAVGPDGPEAWIAAELSRPIDLDAGPLCRHALLRLPDGALGWFLRHHRLVDDEAGLVSLVRRTAELYAADAAAGSESGPGTAASGTAAEELPPSSAAATGDADRQYWQRLLEGVRGPEPTAVPPAGPAVPPADLDWLAVADRGALSRAARAGGGGAAAVLLAAAAVTAHRLTGARDLVIGHWSEVPTGRPYGRRGLVVPVRLAVTPGLSFTEVVRRAGLALRRGRRHGHLPDQDLPWGPSSPYGMVTGLADSGLRVAFGARARAVLERAWSEPAAGLFLRADTTAEEGWRIGAGGHGADPAAHRRLVRLLERLVARPDAPVGSFDLAADDELAAAHRANSTDRPRPETTVTEAFAAQVRRTPRSVAVRGRGVTFDYTELDERSDRVAGLLAGLGVGREDVVAVMLPRTPDTVAALLGVLKAGAAYLPVDPGYPAGRVAFLIEDARPTVVLTTGELAGTLPAAARDGQAPPRIVALDAPEAAPGPAGTPAPEAPLPGNAAYVIYTSGSTGRPKGVVVTHRNVVNFADWSVAELGADAFSRVLASTSFSFDMSVFEILVPLLCGGSVDLVGSLLSLLEQSDWSGSLINTVPSVYRQVTQAEWVTARAANHVFCGEPLTAQAVRRVHERNPGTRVFNIYGPTEVTVYATSWLCPPDGTDDPPIGVPVTNVRCHVLDAALRPQPPGVLGELYLAGDYLARGYAHRPGLTADRFVADPFGAPGARMYRTGDLARWTEDGRLEFAGRTDHQVKVRGHRVELGEIEACLAGCDGVRSAVVVATDDGEGDRLLTAYLLPAEGRRADPDAVRAALLTDLPEPLVPARIVVLDAFPLNPNGKTDRAALTARAAGGDAPTGAAAADAPRRRDRTRVLCEVFAGVLGLDHVGEHDSFFAIGGDSIRSIKLVRRARRAGLVFSPEDVFTHKTPAGLAEAATDIEDVTPAGRGSRPQDEELVPLDASERAWLAQAFPDHRDVLPLTPLQEGLLFHRQHDREGEDPYVMRMSIDLSGRLDVAALRRAVEVMCRRRPNLLAGFARLPSGRPVQVIPDRGPELREVDLTRLTPKEQEAASERLVAEARATRFDPADPPLIRFTLLHLGPDSYRLLMVSHHILLDGWSNQLFLPELFELYSDPDGLPEPASFRDHLRWLSTRDRDAARQAWRQTLRGPLRPTLVAPGGPRPSAWPARLSHRATPEQSERIGALAARLDVTVNTIMQCCWGLLLAEWTGRTDVLFGAIVSGRSAELPGVESVMGFLINTVPLRITLRPDETAADLLVRVQREQTRLMPHHHLGLTEIQRETGAGELFDTAMVFENFPQAGDLHGALPGVRITAASSETAGHYPLSLMAIPRQGRLEFHFLYRQEMFGADVVEALLGRLLRLLDTLTAAPQTPVAALDLLGDEERARAAAFGRSGDPEPAATVADLFAARAARSPEAEALCVADGSGTTMTYGALDAAANRLARDLLARGAGPEQPVAVLLPRGADLVVALLAVFKAGAVVVPLDPALPSERLGLILRDCRPAAVITDGHRAGRAPLTGRHDLLVLDDAETRRRVADRPAGPVGDAERPTPHVPEHAAYLVYTSGTTGSPKAVVVPHRGLAGVLRGVGRPWRPQEGSRLLQFFSVGFDAGLYEILEALCSGATLVLAPAERLRPGRELERLVHEEKITAVLLPPSALAVLTPGESLPPGTVVRTGAEMVPSGLARRWAEHHLLVNIYGPTETTVAATVTDPLRPETLDGPGAPVGRPVPGTAVHLLDSALRPAGPGRVGEVYLAGAAVARGYLGRPGQTALRFLPDPFAADGTRMYRTGDLARWNDHGELVFEGRADRQVKIRGFRVEPGEIEAALRGYAGVAAAAVRTWPDGQGGVRLVGYVVPAADHGADLAPDAVLDRMRATLPEHAVPADVVVLPELPLTARQKTDYDALPAPQRSGRTAAEPRRTPRTEWERRLCELFAELLVLDSVDVEDDFFQLGGHSLLATRLARRVEATWGGRIDTAEVFLARTPAALAERLESAAPAGPGTAQPPAQGTTAQPSAQGTTAGPSAPATAVGPSRSHPVAAPPPGPEREPAARPGQQPTAAAPGAGTGHRTPAPADPFATLLPIRATGDAEPLFFLHPAGGLGWMYTALLGPLADHPLYALQARGIDDGRPLPGSVEEMADDYVREIRAARPDGPYHLIGWSFGGLVAHAMATRLQEQGQEVALLALLDSYVLVDEPDVRTAALDDRPALYAAMLALAGIEPPAGEPAPTAERFLALVRDSDSPLAGLSERHLESIAVVYENNTRLAAAFRPDRFHGDLLHVAAAPAGPGPRLDPDGWRTYLDGGRLVRHRSDYTHGDLGSPGSLAEIAVLLRTELAAGRERRDGERS